MERLEIKLRHPVVSGNSPEAPKSSLTRVPVWAKLSLATNVLLLLTVFLLFYQQSQQPTLEEIKDIRIQAKLQQAPPGRDFGQRRQWNYNQWVEQLQREADVVAEKAPDSLAILAGDSISLWFPPALLPQNQTWLNQGISGEVSNGLLQRLSVFDRTKPQVIFIMIGINDIIRGFSDETILYNYQAIIEDLKLVHPESVIVVQSILPHRGKDARWEGRERLLEIPNSRILELNRQLARIANQHNVKYLDLYPLFSDINGNLRQELTTDGLHLNDQGYLVWASALQLFSNRELQPVK